MFLENPKKTQRIPKENPTKEFKHKTIEEIVDKESHTKNLRGEGHYHHDVML